MKYNKFSFGCNAHIRFLLLGGICTVILSSCAPSAYFKTPNDINKTAGIIYMQDGTVKKGLITILFENDNARQNVINFVPQGSTNQEDINVNDVKSYWVDGSIYVPKIINLYLNKDPHFLFVKRLTGENDRMQLYELHQLFKSNDTGEETYYYFISLPAFSEYEVVDINSEKLIPNFDIKMSTNVSDCPNLSSKILSKQNGYYYSFFSLRPKKLDVIMRIVKEYNDCK